MKRFLKMWGTLALAIVLAWGVSYFAPVASTAGKPERISVAYCADCVQFHFQDKDGKANGLIIDMWRLWSERTGIAVDFKAATWEESLRMVGDGRADAHAGLFFNEERAKFLEYGTSLTETDTQFFVHKDLPGIEKVEDLTAYKVGVLSGDYVEGFLKKKLPPENIVGFESYEAIMEALREGRLRVFAADTPTGIFHLQKVGLGYVFEAPASKPLYTQKWFVAATKGNTELINVINAGMALVSESERREIRSKWVAVSYKSGIDIMLALQIGGAGAVIVIFIVLWNRRLSREVKQRKQAEAALSRAREAAETAEARLMNAIENVSEGFALFDADKRIMLCNSMYRDIYGYDDEDTAPGTTHAQLTQLDIERGFLAKELGGEETVRRRAEIYGETQETFDVPLADGRWVQIRDRPTSDGGTVSIHTDITKLKQAEEALRASERRLRGAVDSLQGGFALYDAEDRLVLVNDQYTQINPSITEILERGGTFEDVLRANVARGMVAEAVGREEEFLRERLARHRNPPAEPIVRNHTNGRSYLLREVKTPEGGIVLTYSEITELKRAETTLRENEERFRDFSEAASDWFWEMDENLRFTYFSDRFTEISGVANEDLIGKTRQESGLDLKDDKIRRNIADLESHRPFKDFEHSRTLANGDVVYMSTMGTPVFAADGNFKGYRGTGRDITERKRAEEALQEAYEVIKDQKERMQDELNIGREIQMSMVPLVFPPFPDHDEFSIYATLEPAREVGGDFYDFYFIDEERLCFCIGDVSGKGVPSALFMVMAKTLLKSRAADDASTASILTHVNDELIANNKSWMFVTIFAGILNIRTGELVYTNAGHNPPYLRRKDGHWQRLDRRHGPVIGAVEGMVYKEERDTMEPGDLLFLYSDGVTEARDSKKRLFSENRLKELLRAGNTDDTVTTVDNTLAAVRAFEGGAEQSDDITILGLEFHGGSEEAPVAKQRIVIKNHLPEIAAVNEKFGAFAEEFDIPVPVAMKLKLIFDELLNNIISYAYRDDAEHDIETRIELAGKRLTVTITDDGVPFNPLIAAVPDTNLPLEEREIGGLGIHLVRNLVDDVSYQRRIDKNVMTMVKHL